MERSELCKTRRQGRPLSFDRDRALDQAMRLFWQRGYETTSVAELTAAMAITPPSLYAAFGNKQTLFLEAVDRYLHQGPVTADDIVSDAATAREAAAAMLRGSAVAFTTAGMPPGCLIASAAATGSETSTVVRATLGGIRRAIMDTLRDKAEQDVASGRLPAGTDTSALAFLTIAVIQGMSVLARDGADQVQLLALANTAIKAWPADC